MKKKILTIQGSSLKKINIETDTTFFLGLEAQKRNYDIYYYEPNDLSFVNGKVKDMRGNCFKCLTPLKPDYTQFKNYCLDC